MNRRWFGGKARVLQTVEVSDVVPFCPNSLRSYFILAKVKYASGPAETYAIPLIHLSGGLPDKNDAPAVLRLQPAGLHEEIVLKDAVADEQFLTCLLDAIAQGLSFRGAQGELRAVSTNALRSLWQPAEGPLTPSLMKAEQSNSSVSYDKRLMLKIFRRVEEGQSPDLEIGSFLTEKSSFRNVPPVAGYLEYLSDTGARTSLGVLQGYVENQGDAWEFTLKALAEYYRQEPLMGSLPASEILRLPILALSDQAIPDQARRRIGSYLDSAALLGRRTAELHLALASASDDPNFTPQPFSRADRQALVNSALDILASNFDLLRRRKDGMPDHIRLEAEKVLHLEDKARQRFQLLNESAISAVITRIHGDYHLGQVLYTGSDFVIIDFEGEPARSLEERRKKRSPLQDVAGMLRSFHYAAYTPLLQQPDVAATRADRPQALGTWAHYWQTWVSAAFLRTYLEVARDAPFIPRSREELTQLLDVYLLDKAVYELGYELNNRPSWVRIPLDGITQLLQDSA